MKNFDKFDLKMVLGSGLALQVFGLVSGGLSGLFTVWYFFSSFGVYFVALFIYLPLRRSYRNLLGMVESAHEKEERDNLIKDSWR